MIYLVFSRMTRNGQWHNDLESAQADYDNCHAETPDNNDTELSSFNTQAEADSFCDYWDDCVFVEAQNA